jgi:pantoate--beta-alanine ligase
MPIIQSLHELEEFKKSHFHLRPWGLVPTMGALHKGHISLIEKAARENHITWISIFVNPTQFNNPKDLANYPHTLSSDLEAIQKIAPQACVFVPDVRLMYPEKVQADSFDFSGLDMVMEGAYRPGHFQGVATVVERLFELIGPDRAYFGEKDFQQLKIVEQIAEKMKIDIQACPIVREVNGLAMSSRNRRLNEVQKEQAAIIYNILNEVKRCFGETPIEELNKIAEHALAPLSDFKLEYFEIANENTLKKIINNNPSVQCRAFISVWVGDVRLIDNMLLN